MNKTFILLFMLFCHIIDDYKIQSPVLANLKQREYWQANAPDELYKYDYIMALIMHSLSWSFMVMLPIAITMNFNIDIVFVSVFIVNAVLHGIIDDAKANRGLINLIIDQCLHLIQIVVTALVLIYLR